MHRRCDSATHGATATPPTLPSPSSPCPSTAMDTADFHSHSHDHSSPYPHEHSHTHSHDHDHRDHGPRDLAPNGDGIMDESFYPPGGSDSAQIYTSLSSYHAYRRLAHSSLTHTRRQTFYSLPLAQQTLLSAPPISFLETLNTLDAAISDNADLADRIFEVSVDCFGVERDVVRDSRFARLVTAEEMEKVRSTLKQFYRDWSSEGGEERRVAYGPVMEELERRFGSLGPEEKGKIEVLVPGAGLGRLAFDIAVAGYASQGNEHSFHQLMASNYILNFSPSAHCHTLHPWIHSFSNHRTRASHLRGIQIPDVHPAGLLSNAGDRFSMAAGSFVSAYGTKECEATFDVVATVFFIDTAVNIVDYIETIRNVLRPGGVWINNGPLLWHWEGRDPPPPPAMEEGEGEVVRDEAKGVELTLDEVLVLVEKLGFKVERRMKAEKGEYVGTGDEGMLKYVYEGEFWVAVKV